MTPHGLALVAYLEGDAQARLTIRRDDGNEDSLPVRHFFRPATEFTPVELAALERCDGRVLDVGAGAGIHSLVLQERGLRTTAIDISPHAVEIMTRRGVRDARCADIFEFEDGPYETVLMLGHGIGIVGDLPGLNRFLHRARRLVGESGQVLLDSLDVRQTDDPRHLAYHQTNRSAGRYVGVIRLQFEFQGQSGPYCRWLHVDPETLRRHAEAAGWTCEVVLEQDGGSYLARLTRAAGK